MTNLTASFSAHPTLWILGTWWVFSAGVSALPQPKLSSNPFYQWVFNFSHTLAGSIGAIMQKRYPEASVVTSEVHPTSDGGIKATTTSTTTPEK